LSILSELATGWRNAEQPGYYTRDVHVDDGGSVAECKTSNSIGTVSANPRQPL
jgi:hypothetical protein